MKLNLRFEQYLYIPFLLKIIVDYQTSWIDLVALFATIVIWAISREEQSKIDLSKSEISNTSVRLSDIEVRLKDVEKVIDEAKKLLNHASLATAFNIKAK